MIITLPTPHSLTGLAQAGFVAVIAGYLVAVIPGVRATPGYSVWLDGVWQPLAFLCAAGICIVRNRTNEPDRRGWRWVSLALLMEAAAETVWAWWVRPIDPEPYPSWADALWLSFYIAMLMAILRITWIRVGDISLRLVLDGVLIALGIASVAIALVLPRVSESGAGFSEAAVNLAYPILDVTLMAFACAAIAMSSLRPPPGLWFLAAGMLVWAVADSLYLLQIVGDSYASGGLLDGTWVLAATCVAFGPGWSRNPASRARIPMWSAIVAPIGAALLAISVIVARDIVSIGLPAKYLAVATILVSLARLALAYRDAHHEQRNAWLARTDELTGVWNRRGFNEIAGAMCLSASRSGTVVAFLLLDINDFKAINDTHGHPVGDRVLKVVAARIQAAVREGDHVARLGGDEFVILLAGGDARVAHRVAKAVRTAIGQPVDAEGAVLHLDASIGIAILPRDGQDPEQALRHADKDLYRIKSRAPSVGRATIPRQHRR